MASSFVHCELSTSDVAKAKSFYSSLFGWELTDMPMAQGSYTMIGVADGDTGGGIMQQ